MRKIDLPEPASLARRSLEGETRSYGFLTYVFGGGARVRAHRKLRDPVTPIRGASIRGQLRFWWRACNPRGCATLDDLRRVEGEVWGTTDRASPVVVEVVRQPPAPAEVKIFTYKENGRLAPCLGPEIAYGAFPLQPKRELQQHQEPPGVLYDYGSATFQIRFLFPSSLGEDVRAALWAWETWGGLGARTRRGFGALLACDRPAPEIADLLAQLATFADRPRLSGVPSLAGARFAVGSRLSSTALPAWKMVLGVLQRLRQGEGLGRNRSTRFGNRPGRSRWPEADAIRRLTRQSALIHSTPTVTVDGFPRAAFGMPIVFHFQNDRHDPNAQGDPDLEPLELRPAEFERFASPLFLRPIPTPQGFLPGAPVLSSPVPKSILLAGSSRFPVKTHLTSAEAARIPALASSISTPTNPDPLERFLEELR